MKYFDLLFTLQAVGDDDDAFYRVVTVEAPTLEDAIRKGRAIARRLFYPGAGGNHYTQRFWTAGEAGSFDNFIGREVGSFIKEAFEVRS